MVALQLRHDEVNIEGSSGNDVNDVDRSGDELEPTSSHTHTHTHTHTHAVPNMTSSNIPGIPR